MQTYLMRADSSEGSIQNDWLVMALKAAVESSDIAQAKLLLKRLARQNLSHLQQAEWQLANAEALIKQEQYEQALNTLKFKTSWKLANEQWKSYHQLRAKLFSQQGQYFEAARALTESAEFVKGSEQEVIAQSVWNNLSQYSQYQITQFSAEPDEAVLDGWLQLAIYTKTLSGNIPQLKNTLEKWLEENPAHPAAVYTPKAISNILARYCKTRQYSLASAFVW